MSEEAKEAARERLAAYRQEQEVAKKLAEEEKLLAEQAIAEEEKGKEDKQENGT